MALAACLGALWPRRVGKVASAQKFVREHATPAAMATTEPIRVTVRVRPAKMSENACVACEPRIGNELGAPGAEKRTWHAVLGPQSSQHDAFMQCGMPLVEAAFEGQRGCLFAYGQTGSGKTFSIFGAEGGRCPSKLDGIVPQIVNEIFRRVAKGEKEGNEYMLGVTFVEVYKDRVRDLLAASKSGEPNPLQVKNSGLDGGTEVVGAKLEIVTSSTGLSKLLEEATQRRATGVNNMHAHSSRSHAFLTLQLEKRRFNVLQVRSTGGAQREPVAPRARPRDVLAQPRLARLHALRSPR